jgi:hypothetical protein
VEKRIDSEFYSKWHGTIRGIAARHFRSHSAFFRAISLLSIEDLEQEIWAGLCSGPPMQDDRSHVVEAATKDVYNLEDKGARRLGVVL